MALNYHGLKLNGLKKTSGLTKDYGYYSPSYVEIFYDLGNGDVWGVYQYSLGQNSWTEYHDSNVLFICNASDHMTMQEIIDAIVEKLNKPSWEEEW